MSIVEQLLSNSLIVFGMAVAVVLLAMRLRERSRKAPALESESRRAVVSPVLRFTPAKLQAPFPVETELTERLIAGFARQGVTTEPVPRDRAALLREIGVEHLKAAHPVFRSSRARSLLDSQVASTSHRPPTVTRRDRRPRPARPDRARLQLVRPAYAAAARPPLQ